MSISTRCLPISFGSSFVRLGEDHLFLLELNVILSQEIKIYIYLSTECLFAIVSPQSILQLAFFSCLTASLAVLLLI